MLLMKILMRQHKTASKDDIIENLTGLVTEAISNSGRLREESEQLREHLSKIIDMTNDKFVISYIESVLKSE